MQFVSKNKVAHLKRARLLTEGWKVSEATSCCQTRMVMSLPPDSSNPLAAASAKISSWCPAKSCCAPVFRLYTCIHITNNRSAILRGNSHACTSYFGAISCRHALQPVGRAALCMPIQRYRCQLCKVSGRKPHLYKPLHRLPSNALHSDAHEQIPGLQQQRVYLASNLHNA